MIIRSNEELDGIDFAKGNGLIPLVAQEVNTGAIRMLGYADRAALEISLSSGFLHFWSRSRSALWMKGATSGNTLRLVSLHVDCDKDAALALVRAEGPTCHTGAESCFDAAPFLQQLDVVIEQRAVARERSAEEAGYTNRLLADRNLRLKKIAEESGELVLACADDDAGAVAEEAADLLYHALVACRAAGVGLSDVVETLRKRHS